MNQYERDLKEQEIKAKCDEAGCDKERRAKHFFFYVNDRWDVHPPADFRAFVINQWKAEELEDEEACRKTGRNWRPTERPNPITLWNSDLERQEFYRSRGGAPTAVPNACEEEELPL